MKQILILGLLCALALCDVHFGRLKDSEGNVYGWGYKQATKIQQDPFIAKWSPEGPKIWYIYYDQSLVDTRTVNLTLDEDGFLWAVFVMDGGSYDPKNIRKLHTDPDAFKDVLFDNYGSGGGPHVTLVAKIDPEDGKILKATYLSARMQEGNFNAPKKNKKWRSATNTFKPKEIRVQGDSVFVKAYSAYHPMDPSSTQSNYVFWKEAGERDPACGCWRVEVELPKTLDKILNVRKLTAAELPDEPKKPKAQPKKKAPKKQAPKKEQPKKEQPKKEEPKKVEETQKN
eukprot:TRINITY_DN3421_c0_g2_i1.p1 TRINITY_DN3421_c0_g2~~TRINITY_DN3421_c0_g2_i1.p1  ORF type:complete len:286 (+),score=104.73 TRINITY_DN3421_c0_g2_i1:63-920(+)